MSMGRVKCKFCGATFDIEEVSKPMPEPNPFGFVWMKDSCPNCNKGMDNWYVGVFN